MSARVVIGTNVVECITCGARHESEVYTVEGDPPGVVRYKGGLPCACGDEYTQDMSIVIGKAVDTITVALKV